MFVNIFQMIARSCIHSRRIYTCVFHGSVYLKPSANAQKKTQYVLSKQSRIEYTLHTHKEFAHAASQQPIDCHIASRAQMYAKSTSNSFADIENKHVKLNSGWLASWLLCNSEE